jgi:hypothetical protein
MARYTTTADDLTNDLQSLDDPLLYDRCLDDLLLNDLEAASWGATWQPAPRSRPNWPDGDDDSAPDERSPRSFTMWDDWPIIERFDQSRLLLVST